MVKKNSNYKINDNHYYWNRQIFLEDFMSFYKFLCDSISMFFVGSRRFLLKNYLSIVFKRFYPSFIYIISQNPLSYLRIDRFLLFASTGYGSNKQ